MTSHTCDNTIREATLQDLAALVTLEQQAQARPWSEAQLLEELEHADSSVLVMAGSTGLRAMVCLRRMHDELWILQVGTHRDARRRGYARQLLGAAAQSPLAATCTSTWLEVRASNRAAIALYERMGFVEVGCRPHYYPALNEKGPREAAVLFQRFHDENHSR